jgi:diguanylate cyclase (GGDEF)-like protein
LASHRVLPAFERFILRLPLSQAERVGLLAAILGVGALLPFAIPSRAESATSAATLPWWLLAIAFAAAEIRVIDFHYRAHTHSFSFSEVPLVLALFFLPPGGVVLSVSVGSAIGLALSRQQSLAKGAFNVAQYSFAATIAALIFGQLRSWGSPPGPLDWFATLVAVAAANAVGVAAIWAAIRLSGGRPAPDDTMQAVSIAFVVGLTNASIGLLLVSVLVTDPAAALLLLVPVAMLFVAYQAYIKERARHERLEQLYQATRLLQRAADVEPTVQLLLEHARTMFAVEVAELTLIPTSGTEAALRVLAVDGAAPSSRLVDPPAIGDPLRGPALDLKVAYRIEHQASGLDRPIANGIACALRGDSRLVGVLLLANRDEGAGPFTREDLRLLETLSNHAASAFENVELMRALQSISRQRDSLSVTASHDSLTRLPNRLQFLQELSNRVDRQGPSVPSVLFIDLDDFKLINDEWGHAAGDAVLIAVAGRILHAVTSADLPARLGGDEFAVLVEDAADQRRAQRVAHRILEELSVPVIVEGRSITVRASIGVASPNGHVGSEALLALADGAMYRAKAAGKHRVSFASSASPASIVADDAKIGTETAAELAVVYQPIVELASGRVIGLEALMRRRRPDGSYRAPDEMLLALGDQSRQRALNQWVLGQACATLAKSFQAGGDRLVMSVNLTVTQLLGEHLLDDIGRALSESGLDPGALQLEVSEGAVLPNRILAATRIAQLRAIGVGIMLDDFAAGRSALDALRDLPLRGVKLASGLLHNGLEPSRTRLLQGVVALTRALRLETVAKGIETTEHLAMARGAGCDLGQGYLLGAPLSDADALALVMRRPAPGPTRRDDAARPRLRADGAVHG